MGILNEFYLTSTSVIFFLYWAHYCNPTDGANFILQVLLCQITAKLVKLLKKKSIICYKDIEIPYTTKRRQYCEILPGASIRNLRARKNQGTSFREATGTLALFFRVSAFVLCLHTSFCLLLFLQSNLLSLNMINIEIIGLHVSQSIASSGFWVLCPRKRIGGPGQFT